MCMHLSDERKGRKWRYIPVLAAVKNSPVNDNVHAYPTPFALKISIILPHYKTI